MSGAPPPQIESEIGPDGRPDFLVKLGVLLPCTPEDVKQAYLAKVKSAHPDVGGSQEEFMALHEAFERATEYAHFLSGRRKWLGIQIERYVEQQAAIEHIEATGGEVTLEHKDWLSREIGEDFAQVLDSVVALRWTGPRIGDAQVTWLVARKHLFSTLRLLDLSHSGVSDEGMLQLAELPGLERLDLEGAPVTHEGLKVVEALSGLAYLNVRGTRIGAFRLYRLRRHNRELEIVH